MQRIIFAALTLLLVSGTLEAQSPSHDTLVIKCENAVARAKLQTGAEATLAAVRNTWDVTGHVAQGPIRIEYTPSADQPAGYATFRLGEDGPPADVQVKLRGDLSSVAKNELPRQLTHIVLASQYGAGPRWVEMGTGLLAESKKQRRKNWQKLRSYRNTGKLLPLGELLAYMQYPSSSEDLKTMYVQSLGLTKFVIENHSRHALLAVAVESTGGKISHAVEKHLGYRSIGDFDVAFRQWLADRFAE